jgi:carbonic anhydrase
MSTPLFMILALGALAHLGQACISMPTGPYNHMMYGDDWPGMTANNSGWACDGSKQSPVDFPRPNSLTKMPKKAATEWSYTPLVSNGSNIQVWNNGHTINVVGLGLESTVKVSVPVDGLPYQQPGYSGPMKQVMAIPQQFHFHSRSEHLVDGMSYPMEMHIVHYIFADQIPACAQEPLGICPYVTGFFMALSEEDNPVFEHIFAHMPLNAATYNNVPEGVTLDIMSIFPYSRSYFSYEGSLTTPPCVEGVFFNIMTQPIPISQSQINAFTAINGLHECPEAAKDKHRKLMAEAGEVDLATCDLKAYAASFRNPQPINGRTINIVRPRPYKN